ncbi:unnamed protein product, partial [Mesorhabditis belari]|uniref:Uncharacterized protein n=1 Tax=Mesorhabditis belari TaxID=2138241 RepID=A0AAF3ET49_9BILA
MWQNHVEIIKVFGLGTALTIITCVLVTIRTNLSAALTDPNAPHAFEISPILLLKVNNWTCVLATLIFSIALFTNLFAIYRSVVNRRLAVTVRVLATAENVNRFVITFSELFTNMCSAFAICRYMVIASDGTLLESALRWPFGQCLFCYALGSVKLVGTILSNRLAYESRVLAQTVGTINNAIPMTIVCFMIVLDLFTLLRVRKWAANHTSHPDKRLLKQMLISSCVYFIQYVVFPSLYWAICTCFGFYLQNAIFLVINVLQFGIYTLGMRLD